MDLRPQSTFRTSLGGDAGTEARGGPLQTAAYRVAVVAVAPLERACVRGGVGAQAITLASLGLAVVAAWLAAASWVGWAGGVYLLSGACDLLDGRVARSTATASARGAALDSIADRLAEAFVVGGLAWGLRGSAGPALCYAFVVASMLVSYARARGEGLGVRVDAGAMARGPRLALLGAAMLLEGIFGAPKDGPSLAFLSALALLAGATSATALVRIVLVLRALPGPGETPPRTHRRRVHPLS
jgi:CDP-diacylglycerol--glycerol-3-phosphate 3-phosphatidyltransferase